MTLEQQVASLVTATTALTNVVNSELESVRAENSTFKASTSADITSLFNNFTSQFDQVKLKTEDFYIYVDPISGSSSPVNPINNQAAPFNTIANALNHLRGYYWSNGQAIIKLTAGNHLVTAPLTISHPCSIRIEGASIPTFSGVQAIVSQTTNANRTANSSTTGSNANLFNHLESIFESRIVFTGTNVLFRLENCTFYLYNCLAYTQNKDNSSVGMSLGRNVCTVVRNSAFMYFSSGIQSYSTSLTLEEFVLFSANVQGLINYGSNIVHLINSFLYFSGNEGTGYQNELGTLNSRGSVHAYGNGMHGIYSVRGEIVFTTISTSIANFACGFLATYGNIVSPSSISQNNGQYGYRADLGLIKALASDANTTGNTLGKKLENNAQQGYVIGVNA
jgi:hypothetical protein